MRGGEGVVDVNIAKRGQSVDDRGVVLLLALVEAGVFEQQDVAVLHRGDGGGGLVADAVFREGDRAAEALGDRCGDGPQRVFRVRSRFRAAEMGEQDHLAALVGDVLDRGQHAVDAGRVGDLPVLHRHVEIDAHENALALGIELIERAERHRFLLVSAAQAARVISLLGMNSSSRPIAGRKEQTA